jgi:hypothetical protein
VPNPENYTIIFNADGTPNGKADCNSFTGTSSQQNRFTIKLGAGTMAFCDDVSIDTQGLPCSWQANAVPATPYEASQPPGPTGPVLHFQGVQP